MPSTLSLLSLAVLSIAVQSSELNTCETVACLEKPAEHGQQMLLQKVHKKSGQQTLLEDAALPNASTFAASRLLLGERAAPAANASAEFGITPSGNDWQPQSLASAKSNASAKLGINPSGNDWQPQNLASANLSAVSRAKLGINPAGADWHPQSLAYAKMSAVSRAKRFGINPSGAAAPLSEDGYAAVADRCCQAEMKQFIERQVQNLGLEICEQAGLFGIVPYHSCEKGPQTFDKLSADLQEDSVKRCTWIAQSGQCQPIPDDCEKFSGVLPSADCGCSRSRAAQMDLTSDKLTVNNVGGAGPDTGVAEEYRVSNAGVSSSGVPFDLVVIVVGDYSTFYPEENGIFDGFGAINIKPKNRRWPGQVLLRYNFYEPGTYNSVTLEEFHFATFDLDGTTGAGGLEYVSSKGYKGYVTDVDPLVVASRLDDGTTQFISGDYANDIANPSNPESLTDEQRRNSIMYFFTDVSTFDITFGIDGRSSNALRILFFAGKSSLDDRCGD